MPRPRSDRPTEPLSIWQRSHTRSERGRKRVNAGRWAESRWFWGAIAAITVAAIGLFSTALLLGPVSLPGRLVSLPSIPAGFFPPSSPGVVQTHADPAAGTAPGAIPGSATGLLAVPVTTLISPGRTPAARTTAPRTSWSLPGIVPIAVPSMARTHSDAPWTQAPSGPADPASTFSDPPGGQVQPRPTHGHRPHPSPAPTASMPDIVPSVQVSASVQPDPLPILTDPPPLWGLLPSTFDTP